MHLCSVLRPCVRCNSLLGHPTTYRVTYHSFADRPVGLMLITVIFLQNSLEEVATATAYLDLFLRTITEPSLMSTFLRFILTEKHDEIVILDSLITRINSNSKVSIQSLGNALAHAPGLGLRFVNCTQFLHSMIHFIQLLCLCVPSH